ncbi:SLBB domain-containing protein [Pedobacter foliorum]|uniref:SLBB domain-containing protein n=1 Tax=Pedobacter foliorum TaxID=2739058 RepID=UPI0015658290|nr:SLBB domain-containing protein [Pedobacter foliorum]NRF39168.1 SLBB domain-containing protein [Pedobacter foliorum]
MNNKFRYYILLILLVIGYAKGQAQTVSMSDIQNVKVSQLSDAQIKQAWDKLQESGVPEQEAYKLMLQKGMPAGEVQAFKDRVVLLGLNKKVVKVQEAPEQEKKEVNRDTANTVKKPEPIIIEKPAPEPPLGVYGMEFFNQTAIKFEPNFSLATPKSYVLGPGDELIVLVTGLNETSIRTKITPEGNLQIPRAGIIYLNGFTIEQATGLIRNKMTKVYPALSGGQTQVAVNLGNTRSIKVTLIGEVKTPGSYTISSLSTLFNALYNSGGPNANGSLRYIELLRNNKLYKTIDFYSFLQKGLMDGNVRLEDQDVIRIPVYKKRVGIKGEIKRPAIYELKENEQLEDLISYAGGFTDIAYRGIAKVDQINALEREVKDVPANLFGNFTPHNGDLVQIGAITNRYTNRIVLEGAVNRPGVYELTAGLSLSELLKTAQGLKVEAYMERGYIKRTLPNLEREMISFNPADVISGKSDVPLMREDSITIQDRSVFVSQQNVTVNGFVKKPTTFTFRKGMKLGDVIAMAGGFQDEAAEHHIEISRIIKNTSDSVANQLVKTFTIDLNNNTSAEQELELQPMDYIYVPRLVNYKALGNISVKGEVLFPGDYAVQRRDETALDLLQRAGGLSPYGALENAQVYRKGTRLNLDLTSKSNDPNVKRTMILLPGDSIYIPRAISLVEVSGAVNNPQLISYNGRRFKYYINAAAGTKENARLKGAYVQYPNGLNKPVGHFLFFRTYPAVKPGSKIVVPLKDPNNKFRLGFAEISGLTSAITALVGLIAILSK